MALRISETMPIYRRTTAEHRHKPNVRAVHDIPGYESGRIQHGGKCVIRGMNTPMRMNTCTDACVGPSEPVYIETVFNGLVLSTGKTAVVVWDVPTHAPLAIPLMDDGVYPMIASVCVGKKIKQIAEDWYIMRDLEQEERDLEEARITARRIWEKEEAQAHCQREREKLFDEVRLRQIEGNKTRIARERLADSRIVVGLPVVVLSDSPAFIKKNKGIKERNRQASRIGYHGFVISVDWLDYTCVVDFSKSTLTATNGAHLAKLRMLDVRRIFPDGSYGDQTGKTLAPPKTPPPVKFQKSDSSPRRMT